MTDTSFPARAEIAALRNASFDKALENNAELCPGVYLSWQDTKAEVTGRARSDTDILLETNMQISGSPDWVSLNIALGNGTLRAGDSFGVVARVSGSDTASLPGFLRTAWAAGGTYDTLLQDPLKITTAPSVQVVLHEFQAANAAHGDTAFHTLILPLPQRNFSLTIHDVDVFLTRASEGLHSAPTMLTSYGV